MIRALVWKEYREHRWTFVGFLTALFLLKPALGWLAEEALQSGRMNVASLCFMLLSLCLPIYAVILGAHTFAHERGKGTLAFLLTRPIGRLPILGTKLLVSLAFLTAGLAASTLIINRSFSVGWDNLTLNVLGAMAPTATAVIVLIWSFTLAASTLCRGFLSSILLGGAGAAAFFTGLGAGDLGEQALPLCLVLGMGSAVAVAHAIFDLPLDSPLRARLGRALRTVLVSLVVAYVALHGCRLFMDADGSTARIHDVVTAPTGMVLNLEVPSYGPFYRPIQLPVLRDGAGEARVLHEHQGCRVLNWSPDGRFMVMRSRVNRWGFQGSKSRLRIARADGTLVHEEYWGRANHQVCWSRDGKTLAYAVAKAQPLLFAGSSRSELVLFQPETGRRHVVASERLDEIAPWDWQPVAIRREGKSVLVLVDRNDEDPARLEEIGLDGSVLAVHGPFGDEMRPSFTRQLGTDRLLFDRGDDEGTRLFMTWDATRPTELTPAFKISKSWRVLAFSDDLSQAVVIAGEKVKGKVSQDPWLSDWKWNYRLATLSLTGHEAAGSAPAPEAVFLRASYTYTRGQPYAMQFPTVCWSARDRAFLYQTDGTALRVIRPGATESKPYFDPKTL